MVVGLPWYMHIILPTASSWCFRIEFPQEWLVTPGIRRFAKKNTSKNPQKNYQQNLALDINHVYIYMYIYIYISNSCSYNIYMYIQFHNIYDMISNSYIHPTTSAYSRFSINVCFCIPKKTASFGFLEFQEGVAKKVLKDDGWIIGFLVGPTVHVGPSIQGNYNTLGNPPSQL